MAEDPLAHHLSDLASVDHLLLHEVTSDVMSPLDRQLFLSNVAVYFRSADYPLSSLRIVRCRGPAPPGEKSYATKQPGIKTKDSWYAAIVALTPESTSPGFQVLFKGTTFVGGAESCRQEVLRGLRDSLELAMHEKVEQAISEWSKQELPGSVSADARVVEAGISGARSPPAYDTLSIREKELSGKW